MPWISHQLGEAILTNDIERLKRTLIVGKKHVNTLIDNEISPLEIATNLKYTDMVALLRANGADETEEYGRNAEDAKWEKVSIFDAIKAGDAKSVNELCRRGEFSQVKPFTDYESNNNPPLLWAVQYNRPECLQTIMKYDKTDINQTYDYTIQGKGYFALSLLELALYLNTMRDMKKVIKLLLSAGAQNPKDDSQLISRGLVPKATAVSTIQKIKAEMRAVESRGVSELVVAAGLPQKLISKGVAQFLPSAKGGSRRRKVSRNKTYKRKNM